MESNFEEMNRHVTEKVELDDVFLGFWGDFPTIKIFQMFGQQWLNERTPDDLIKEMIDQVERERHPE